MQHLSFFSFLLDAQHSPKHNPVNSPAQQSPPLQSEGPQQSGPQHSPQSAHPSHPPQSQASIIYLCFSFFSSLVKGQPPKTILIKQISTGKATKNGA